MSNTKINYTCLKCTTNCKNKWCSANPKYVGLKTKEK